MISSRFGRRRIAVERRLHVADQHAADLRQPAEKNLRQLMRARRALAQLRLHRFALPSVAQAVLHFVFELRRQPRQQLRHVRTQIVPAQVVPPEVARIHQIEHRLQDLHDGLARRQIAMRNAPSALIAQVARQELSGQFLERRGRRLSDGFHVVTSGRQAPKRPPASFRLPRTGPRTGRPTGSARRHPAESRRWSCPFARVRVARRSAAAMAAPQEMPHNMPSSRASRRAISMASSLVTCSTRSTSDRSRFCGMNPAPMPWILCGDGVSGFAGARLRDDRRVGRLDRDGDNLLAARALDVSRYAGQGAAGADAADEDVDLAVGVVPDFRPGGLLVDRRIGRIVELLHQQILLRIGGASSSAFAMAPFMPLAPGVSISLAPKATSTLRRSMLMVSGMVSTQP